MKQAKETAKQAITRLHKEGYDKLFLVDCYITDMCKQESTRVWNIYADEEDAKRWPRLCKDYYSKLSYMFADGTKHFGNEYECVFSYCFNKKSPAIVQRFKISAV